MVTKLFLIKHEARSQDFYPPTPKVIKVDSPEKRPFEREIPPTDGPLELNYAELRQAENKEWVYYRGISPTSFSLAKTISQIYWKTGSWILIEAKSLEEALRFFRIYFAYGNIPQKNDPAMFIDESINGELAQQRIIKGYPLSEEDFNEKNWPLKVVSIEIFSKCKHTVDCKGTLFCYQCIQGKDPDFEDFSNFCRLGSDNSREFWEEKEFEELGEGCPIKTKSGKTIKTSYPFTVIDYTGAK